MKASTFLTYFEPVFAGHAGKTRSAARLYLPAYLALFIALGGACRALTHFIGSPGIAPAIWSALSLNILIGYGLRSGIPPLQNASKRARLIAVVLLPTLLLIFHSQLLIPEAAESELNSIVMLLVGWSAVLSVLAIGARHGERRIPMTVPLVPSLSLFGLLNSLSVDTIIQVCFVIFVAASLYLVAYERILLQTVAGSSVSAEKLSPLPTGAAALSQNIAIKYLVACALWMFVFLAGAALFYYPAKALLPRVLSVPFSAVRGSTEKLLDWRSSASPTLELRGGNYPLSDHELFEVTLALPREGNVNIPALWRGRIYDKYSDSRWSESQTGGPIPIRLKSGGITELQPLIAGAAHEADEPLPRHFSEKLDPHLVREDSIRAYVKPLDFRSPTLFFPGELTHLWSTSLSIQSFPNGVYRTSDLFFRNLPYAFQAQIKEEKLMSLLEAPGLSKQELKEWKENPMTADTLALDSRLRKQLKPIVEQINSSGDGTLHTPAAKANAIHTYLTHTCLYSLAAPLVPATEDAVMYFMTESQQGACDMFASSMAVLLRAMDVPSRLATGYIQPEEMTEGQTTTGGSTLSSFSGQAQEVHDRTGFLEGRKAISFTVREREAHAWVEYYVPGAGWLAYDPTAGTRTTQLPLDAQIATMLNLPTLRFDWKVLRLPLLGATLIVISLFWSALDLNARRTTDPKRITDRERARILSYYRRAVRMLDKYVPRAPHQTPLEYEAAVNRSPIAAEAKQEFTSFTYLIMAAGYQREVPPLETTDLQASLARLKRALRAKPRA